MVKYVPQKELDFIFQSLADPTRREILERISEHDLTVTDIAKPYNMSLPAVSKHLKVLERAHLVIRKKIGREYLFSLNLQPIKEAARYLSFYRQFWSAQFGSLQKILLKKPEF